VRYATLAVRLALGVWMVMSGYRFWQPNMPMGRETVAKALLASLVDSNLMLFVKLIELGLGACLILNLFVPLALVAGFPVTVVVAYVCLVLEFPATRPLVGGGLTLAAHVFLLVAYLPYYRAMLVARARLPAARRAPSG
jgi:hypothetical protein